MRNISIIVGYELGQPIIHTIQLPAPIQTKDRSKATKVRLNSIIKCKDRIGQRSRESKETFN